jgi:hypothetical protein
MEVSRSKFNSMLQDVQAVEAAVGYSILRLRVEHDAKTGSIVSATWSFPQGVVFRQEHPFTDRATYAVEAHTYAGIVFSDPTK